MNKQFVEWLIKNNYHTYMMVVEVDKELNPTPFSMMWGVYLEFFDSVGIDLVVLPTKHYFIWAVFTSKAFEKGKRESRQEAQQAAIKIAFELLA